LFGCAATAAACRATQPQKPEPSAIAEADAGAPIPAVPPAPPSLSEETPTGKLVAFRDEADMKDFTARWHAREEEKRKKAEEERKKAEEERRKKLDDDRRRAEEERKKKTPFPMNGPELDAGAPLPYASVAPPSAAPAGQAVARDHAPAR